MHLGRGASGGGGSPGQEEKPLPTALGKGMTQMGKTDKHSRGRAGGSQPWLFGLSAKSP